MTHYLVNQLYKQQKLKEETMFNRKSLREQFFHDLELIDPRLKNIKRLQKDRTYRIIGILLCILGIIGLFCAILLPDKQIANCPYI